MCVVGNLYKKGAFNNCYHGGGWDVYVVCTAVHAISMHPKIINQSEWILKIKSLKEIKTENYYFAQSKKIECEYAEKLKVIYLFVI